MLSSALLATTVKRLLLTKVACTGFRPTVTWPTLVSPVVSICVLAPSMFCGGLDALGLETTTAFACACGCPPGLIIGRAMGRKVSPQPASKKTDNTMAMTTAAYRTLITAPGVPSEFLYGLRKQVL